MTASRAHVGWTLALTACLLAASILFYAVPALDLRVSGVFYDGRTFPVATLRPVEALRDLLIVAEDAWFLLTLACAWRAAGGRRILRLARGDWLYQVMIFLLGPGLIVNGILKRLWGRARPFQVIPFGGDKAFSRAWVIADQCSGNCSFVSGEAAGATALAICLWLVLRVNRPMMGVMAQCLTLAAILAIPLLTVWQRIAAGRHFLSDVVIAALIVALLAALLQMVPSRRPAG